MVLPAAAHGCRRAYLEQLPARVEVVQAVQVGGRQLHVVRPERGRQLVHVRHVVLDGSDLVLELLQRGGGGAVGQMVVVAEGWGQMVVVVGRAGADRLLA